MSTILSDKDVGRKKRERSDVCSEIGPRRKEPRVEDTKLAMNEKETDARRLSQRRKEISYGKNTLGYERYLKMIPKGERKRGHPKTPDVEMKASKRQFDGIVKAWRRRLHEWDPPTIDPPPLENPLLLPSKRSETVQPAVSSVQLLPIPDEDQVQEKRAIEEDDDDFGPAPFFVLPAPALPVTTDDHSAQQDSPLVSLSHKEHLKDVSNDLSDSDSDDDLL